MLNIGRSNAETSEAAEGSGGGPGAVGAAIKLTCASAGAKNQGKRKRVLPNCDSLFVDALVGVRRRVRGDLALGLLSIWWRGGTKCAMFCLWIPLRDLKSVVIMTL